MFLTPGTACTSVTLIHLPAVGTDADVELAVSCAKKAFESWSKLPGGFASEFPLSVTHTLVGWLQDLSPSPPSTSFFPPLPCSTLPTVPVHTYTAFLLSSQAMLEPATSTVLPDMCRSTCVCCLCWNPWTTVNPSESPVIATFLWLQGTCTTTQDGLS